jgi:hypothetical protein
MKDFLLGPAFLRSSVDLPMTVRENIIEALEMFSRDPRNRELDLSRLEGSKSLYALRIASGERIILRSGKSPIPLLIVESGNGETPLPADEGVIAPVEAIQTLLVQEKYLPLARRLLSLDSKTREVEFPFAELEKIVGAHFPPEARQYPNWWANQKSGNRAQSFAWMAAGWIVDRLDIKARLVRMKRV